MSNLIPDNLIETLNYPPKCAPRTEIVRPNKPYEEYDKLGNLIGYSWYQGDTVKLHFHIDGRICVEADAIVLTAYGEVPPKTPVEGDGVYVDVRAYNIVEHKVWICTSIDETGYTWELLEDADYPEYSTRSYYVTAAQYLIGKLFEFKILNFRKQPIYETQQDASPDMYFSISREVSQKIPRGAYTVELNCINPEDTEKIAIIAGNDCQLFVR